MNQLKIELDKFLDGISATQSLLFQTTTHLKNHKKNLLKGWEGTTSNHPIMASTLIMGDLTGPSDDRWKINYPTGFNFTVELNELETSIDTLIKREGMRSLATCYEILESYLFDVTATYITINQDLLNLVNKLKEHPKTLEESKELLRKLYRSKNNKEILKLIRKLSPTFVDSEKSNNSGMDLNEWYKVLSTVRHGIIHSLFTIKNLNSKFDKYQYEIFKHYFSHDQNDDIITLNLSKQEVNRQIILIAEMGFLIFKAFSIERDYNWNVFKDMT